MVNDAPCVAAPPFITTQFAGHRYVRLPRSQADKPLARIVIDQDIRGGEPVIEGTHVTARSLGEQHAQGDSVSFLSAMYNVPENQVREAISYYRGYDGEV